MSYRFYDSQLCPHPQVLSPVLLDDSAPPLSPLDAARLLAALCLAPREQLTIQRFGLACVRLREALATSSSSRYGLVCCAVWVLPYEISVAC